MESRSRPGEAGRAGVDPRRHRAARTSPAAWWPSARPRCRAGRRAPPVSDRGKMEKEKKIECVFSSLLKIAILTNLEADFGKVSIG